MRSKQVQRLHPVWLLLPLFLSLGLWLFVRQSTVLQVHPDVAWGVLADLLLTVPMLFFLIVRKTKLPNTLTIPCVFMGVAVASSSLPEAQQGIVSMVKQFGIPLIELGVVAFVIFQIRKNRKAFKEKWQSQPDFYTSARAAVGQLLPGKLGEFMSTELSAFYYGLFHWKTVTLEANQFSYHKRSGTPALIGALIVMVLVEMFVVHLLVKESYPIFSLILLLLSGYSAFQFLGFAKALSKRPIQMSRDMLNLRYGIMAEADLPLHAILSVEQITVQPKIEDEVRLSPLGEMERVNVRIILREPVDVRHIYRSAKQTESIAFHVDEPTQFIAALENIRD